MYYFNDREVCRGENDEEGLGRKFRNAVVFVPESPQALSPPSTTTGAHSVAPRAPSPFIRQHSPSGSKQSFPASYEGLAEEDGQDSGAAEIEYGHGNGNDRQEYSDVSFDEERDHYTLPPDLGLDTQADPPVPIKSLLSNDLDDQSHSRSLSYSLPSTQAPRGSFTALNRPTFRTSPFFGSLPSPSQAVAAMATVFVEKGQNRELVKQQAFQNWKRVGELLSIVAGMDDNPEIPLDDLTEAISALKSKLQAVDPTPFAAGQSDSSTALLHISRVFLMNRFDMEAEWQEWIECGQTGCLRVSLPNYMFVARAHEFSVAKVCPDCYRPLLNYCTTKCLDRSAPP